MLAEMLCRRLTEAERYFDRSTECLQEEHSDFRPTEDQYTVAQQVGHVALTVDWFFEGALGEDGFDMDFDAHDELCRAFSSLSEARQALRRSLEAARSTLTGSSDEQLRAPLPEGPVMGGAPLMAIVYAIEDHTAHHRGALTVYSRLLGLEPALPYM